MTGIGLKLSASVPTVGNKMLFTLCHTASYTLTAVVATATERNLPYSGIDVYAAGGMLLERYCSAHLKWQW